MKADYHLNKYIVDRFKDELGSERYYFIPDAIDYRIAKRESEVLVKRQWETEH